MIKQRLMGRTSLKLSELCLGTLNFGWKSDEASAFAILDAYRAAGGNFIQAANWSPDYLLPSADLSRSEDIVGRWCTSRRIPREELRLATRLHLPLATKGDGAYFNAVQNAVKDSMRRLRSSYLDLLILEWNDALPIELTLKVSDLAIRSGAVRFVGAANFPAWRINDALGRARLGNHNRMEVLQADYSLMTRARFEPELMSLSREHRLGFFASSPLAGGFLARGRGSEAMLRIARHRRLTERFGNAYGQVAKSAVTDVASRHEASSAQVALAWVLRNPAVTSAMIGVQSVAQLNELVQVPSVILSNPDLEQLDRATAREEVRLPSDFPRSRLASDRRVRQAVRAGAVG